MNYFVIAKELEEKLADILADRKLLHTLDTKHYPITLTITQNQTPDAQMELLCMNDGSRSSQDSILRFVFDLEGLDVHTHNRFVVDDAFMTKIKGMAKKIHYAYLQAYFADTIELVNSGLLRTDEPTNVEPDDAEAFEGFYDDEETEGEE